MKVRPGEVCLLSGPSGSGKSSLIMSVAGLLAPLSGHVAIGGIRIYQQSESYRDCLRRNHVGLITQEGDLVPELTVAENAALPLRLLGSKPKAANARAAEELRRFGIDEQSNSGVHQISGGQAQRAAIARALVHQPSIILADEPTAALDADNAERVIAIFRDYAELGRSPCGDA